jgi:hypothetical protein
MDNEMIMLPRQAWDKDRETHEEGFSGRRAPSRSRLRRTAIYITPKISARLRCAKRLLLRCHFHTSEKRHQFTKTGSGQTYQENLRGKAGRFLQVSALASDYDSSRLCASDCPDRVDNVWWSTKGVTAQAHYDLINNLFVQVSERHR